MESMPSAPAKSHNPARDLFMYLLMFATLYTSAISIGTILFELINRVFPDALSTIGYSTYTNDSIRWSLASIIIAFPIYFFIAWVLKKEIARDPSRGESKTRKWLTYLTLFFAAGVIIGDLIYLLYNLLGGELTIPYSLKTLVVLVIGGAIFCYYFFDIKKS